MVASAIRTVQITNTSPYAISSGYRWPIADPDDDLDYYADLTIPFVDVNDVAVTATAAIAPSGPDEMQPADLSITDKSLEVWLSGGVPGRVYTVRLDIRTQAGRRFSYQIQIAIDATLATNPLPDPQSLGFGIPTSWALVPVPIPSLNFTVSGNFGAWPFGCEVIGGGTPIPGPPPIPALIFDQAENFGAWPFGCQVTGPGTPIPSDIVVPSLDLRDGRNIGLWFSKLGEVVGGSTPPPPSVPVPSLNFTVAQNFGAWPFGCQVT